MQTPPPTDLVSLQWAIIAALVTALGFVVRQYLVNEKNWQERLDEREKTYKSDLQYLRDNVIKAIDLSVDILESQTQIIKQLKDEMGIIQKLDRLIESGKK